MPASGSYTRNRSSASTTATTVAPFASRSMTTPRPARNRLTRRRSMMSPKECPRLSAATRTPLFESQQREWQSQQQQAAITVKTTYRSDSKATGNTTSSARVTKAGMCNFGVRERQANRSAPDVLSFFWRLSLSPRPLRRRRAATGEE